MSKGDTDSVREIESEWRTSGESSSSKLSRYDDRWGEGSLEHDSSQHVHESPISVEWFAIDRRCMSDV